MSDAQSGVLSEEEALARLRRDGPDRLPPPQHKSFARTLLGVLQQPVVLLLLVCTVLYAALGSGIDAAVLGLSIVGVAAISIYQELRTQRVLEALRDLASPRSSVVRDGAVRRIASQSEVVGDRLIVQKGRSPGLRCRARRVACALRRRIDPDRRIRSGRQGTGGGPAGRPRCCRPAPSSCRATAAPTSSPPARARRSAASAARSRRSSPAAAASMKS